ncbi:hypothetical protein HPP92_011437 [Vanilla planifolia]|uniref:Pentatricopeptide repeat-containing protein n=1 Tax=Vanilla planifolia TaxID=51239 RepID=A0A835UYG0_VANPL|nr:hypothetical protein HPP92_011437 [Vanilla planifolia]
MIQGYAIHGMPDEALRIFSQMLKLNLKPDHVILVALLSACNHAGLIDEGWKHFNSIKPVHGIQPTMEHYACMVDLLSRRGRLREAFDFIKEMPYDANANVWGSLLGSCKIHNEVEIGRAAADHLFGIEGWNIGNYVLMSNIYAANGKWDGVEHVRREMKTKVQRKPAGCSWIVVGRKNNVFVATDLCHPQRHLIYNLLINLDKHLKDPLVKMDSESWRNNGPANSETVDDAGLVDDNDKDHLDAFYSILVKKESSKRIGSGGFFEELESLEEINIRAREWHCPACYNVLGVIERYKVANP